jgi:hypothetical protein
MVMGMYWRCSAGLNYWTKDSANFGLHGLRSQICSVRNCYSGIVNLKTFCKILCGVDSHIATHNNAELHYALNGNQSYGLVIELCALFHAALAMISRACSTNMFAACGCGSASDQAPRRCIGPNAVHAHPVVSSGTTADFSPQRVPILRYTLTIAWSVDVFDITYTTFRDLTLLPSSGDWTLCLFNYWRRLGLNQSRFEHYVSTPRRISTQPRH